VQPLVAQAAGTSLLLGLLSVARGLSGSAAGWAQVLAAFLSAVLTPARRRLFVRRESRTLAVDFEVRTVAVRREQRVLAGGGEDRTFAVPPESRSIDA
jgi:hypothetical protein